ncbi:MAG TPA: Tol-Pal system beta propeller repeat protein TolB [Vicinamibacterales bacterium]|nr:Tol-Pal system beta propeller repeat protein TolB [Vicinamibacterales bacterium]
MLTHFLHWKWSIAAVLAASAVVAASQPPATAQPPASQQQPTTVGIVLTGEGGSQTRLAVPDLLALSSDKETQDAARVISQVLWDDLNFEREFYMIPRDTYKSIPAAASIDAVPYDRWRELGADGVVIGTVQRVATGIRVEMRLYSVRARQSYFGREYTGAAANPRVYAHTMSDELHQSQRNLRGVARTKLAFVSDRNREAVVATVEKRDVKEVYIADYDGANPRRITINRALNITPSWSPDGRAIAYTSYRTGLPDILISNIYAGTMENPTKGVGQNFLPVFSPDGSKIAFMTNRDGNPEIYVVNRDGSNIMRLTNNPATESTPTWSPTGTQIAFTSDRSGTPQIYVVNADGSGLRRISSESYADRATWSPAPYNEIAFSAKTGPGFDIKILNIERGETRQITFGEGSNESPAWAPNGRHLAFMSTRAGRSQIFTVDKDGRNLRQLTRDGNNSMPHWSQ